MENQENQIFYTLCPKCGKMIRAGLKYCPHCGDCFTPEPPKKRVCPNCGKIAPAGERFCSDCGTAYEEQAAAPAQASPAPASSPAAPAAPAPARPKPAQTLESDGKTDQDSFFNKYATKWTKRWATFLPVLGIISAIASLIMAILWAVDGEDEVVIALGFVDVVVLGGLSIAMLIKKRAVLFISFLVYNLIASVLAFISMDFSNILWLVASIWITYKMVKIERAYKAYLMTGALPKYLI